MADPKYVRLADHLVHGMRADLVSGFSIAGYDVVEMPDSEEDEDAYRYVKAELAAGRVEQASKAEYDEVHPNVYADLGVDVEVPKTVVQAGPQVQETHVQRHATALNKRIAASRAEDSEDEDAENERREALIAQQKAAGSGKSSTKTRRAAAKAAQQVEEDDAADQASGGVPSGGNADSAQRHQ